MKTARGALVSAAMSLFSDRLTYGYEVTAFEERMVTLLKEYDKIIDDYRNSDIDLIKNDN
jgi:uncharacterized protein YutD